MDESTVTTSTKESKRTSKLQKLKRADDLLSGSSDNCKPCIKGSKIRPTWKSFFNLFTKTSVDKISTKSISKQVPDISKQVPDTPKDVYLSDINDEFALAICLPDNVTGADVKVDLELEAIKKIDNSSGTFGLKLLKATLSKTTFCGNIKCPSNITVDNISKMPLYFVSAAVITHKCGYKTQKIETIIKPLKDNLPRTIDKEIMVSDIKLVIHLQNLKKIKRSQILKHCKYLNYTFIQNERKPVKPSLHNIKTEEIIEEIVESNETYNEESKTIVKEILNHVVTKVQAQDISTQYSNLVTTVSKEIDVQKSLLLKNSEVNTVKVDIDETNCQLLSKICEKDEIDSLIDAALKTSYESLYPRSSTSFTAKESAVDTESSIFYLKVPHNTPDTIYAPRYIIKYDSLLSIPDKKKYQKDRKRSVAYDSTKHVNHISLSNASPKEINNYMLNEEIKADIDKTLELLERAKLKLLGYLNMSFEENIKYDDYKTSCSKNIKRQNINDNCITPPKNEIHQFFRGESKNSETPNLISFSNEKLVPINTIQNIYNSTYGENPLQLSDSQTDRENVWKNRYSGDNYENNELAYSVVENDINLMIMDLLKESNTLKELAISNMEDDTIRDVKYILELLINRTEESIDIKPLAGDLQAPPNIFMTEAMCINYCILDQNIKGDTAVALMDQKNVIDSPTVSVKKITNACYQNHYINDESFVQKLEKGCLFLSEIYREICLNEIFYVENDILTNSQHGYEGENSIDSLMTLSNSTTTLASEVENIPPTTNSSEQESSTLEENISMTPKQVLIKNNEIVDSLDFLNNGLSNIKYEFVSMQELNNREEIDYIEENLKHNEKIDSNQEDEMKRNKKPFIRKSVESITPVVTDSESSIVINTNEQFQNKE